jgi:hypothetical protein
MNLTKTNRLVMGVLYGRIVIVRERPANERIREGRFTHRSKSEDGNLAMHKRWIGAVWHCSRGVESVSTSAGGATKNVSELD